MILHLLFDHNFTDYVVEQFGSKSMHSDFVLISNTHRMKFFHYVDKTRIVNPQNVNELEQLLSDVSNCDAVVFHGLYYPWQEWLLPRIPDKVKVAWMFWGGEIYGQPDLIETFLAPISKILYKLHTRYKSESADYIFPKQYIKRVDYCLTGVSEEVEFLRAYLHPQIKHLWYTYYSLEDTVGPLYSQRASGKNIFIGNSATIENNHFETLLRLKRVGTGDRNLIVPLSYGSPWERNLCARFGKKLFKQHFEPLADFLPRNEYNAKMLSCSTMIQAHRRPNAHGNIITGLWLGMRVYLSEKSIEYIFFKRIGCIVFSIERDLNRGNKDVFNPLTESEVAINRKALDAMYSKQHVMEAVEKVVLELTVTK